MKVQHQQQHWLQVAQYFRPKPYAMHVELPAGDWEPKTKFPIDAVNGKGGVERTHGNANSAYHTHLKGPYSRGWQRL